MHIWSVYMCVLYILAGALDALDLFRHLLTARRWVPKWLKDQMSATWTMLRSKCVQLCVPELNKCTDMTVQCWAILERFVQLRIQCRHQLVYVGEQSLYNVTETTTCLLHQIQLWRYVYVELYTLYLLPHSIWVHWYIDTLSSWLYLKRTQRSPPPMCSRDLAGRKRFNTIYI